MIFLNNMKEGTIAPSNGFLAVLQRKETQVGTLSEASALLAAAVLAAGITGKKASITLKLEVEPERDALNFTVKLTSSVPTKSQPLCIFYADRDGQLHRDDPAQKELPLQVQDGGMSAEHQEEAAAANG